MSSEAESDTIKFIAQQLLELNKQVKAVNASFGMVRGWMDAQEEATRTQKAHHKELVGLLNDLRRTNVEQGGKLEATYTAVSGMRQELDGLVELGKTALDVATATKEMLSRLSKTGGEDEPTATATRAARKQ